MMMDLLFGVLKLFHILDKIYLLVIFIDHN